MNSLASNRANLADVDSAYSDWIELHNPDAVEVDLTGWYLTDGGQPDEMAIPAVSIPAGGYLVIFASAKIARIRAPSCTRTSP